MPATDPTRIVRFIHLDNLHVYLTRGRIYAPNSEPQDGLLYRTNHNAEVQEKRKVSAVRCGPGGTVHDYVPFYFGHLSPMMLNLKTGRVPDYDDGQEPLIYLVSSCQAVRDDGCNFVFTDGHCLATFTSWFDDLSDLDKVDWEVVYARYWSDCIDDMDRQRRKQAEFLVHGFVDWRLIDHIVVIDDERRDAVRDILGSFDSHLGRDVVVERGWYYW